MSGASQHHPSGLSEATGVLCAGVTRSLICEFLCSGVERSITESRILLQIVEHLFKGSHPCKGPFESVEHQN